MSSGKAKKTESTQGSVLKSKAKISSQIDPQGASQLTEVDREKFLMENTELYTSQKIKFHFGINYCFNKFINCYFLKGLFFYFNIINNIHHFRKS